VKTLSVGSNGTVLYTFGVGVWTSAGQKCALRVAAVLIIGN
jgi:hypothetical protein